VKEAGRPCVKLMPDLFHMNIEDASFRVAFEAARDHITYIHVADSNRLAPGWGHLPFDEILMILRDTGYDGWLTAEILPKSRRTSCVRGYLTPCHTRNPLSAFSAACCAW